MHPTALIDPTAQIAQGAVIGAYTIIGPNVRIGALAWIGPHVSVDRGTVIGHAPTLAAGVRIGQDVTIGDHFIAHPSVVIGADGFSFVTPEPSAVEHVRDTLGDQGNTKAQGWTRIHSLGSVTIGHNVELGANTCVDRGTIRDTQVGDGCKCDNLAQIGHNVIIGRDVMICAQVGIAGSSRIGNNVVLGGQTGVSDNTYIGDNVITGGATKVLANVPAGRVVLGYPAVKMDQQLEIHRALRKLPQLLRDMAFLKKSVSKGDQTP
ncbi:MAG: UDP-3-O-(3-hydroxymyristoyl)glucosamine N-acyltransferase [Pseudomonadota bacterium]